MIPSRRAFQIYFPQNTMDKEQYIITSQVLEQVRSSELINYGTRIIEANKNKKQFDPLIKRILGDSFDWQLELSDSGQSYIQYQNGGTTHTGEGVGDGIWSIFTICEALYNSEAGDTIIIDEPELSVHPSLQHKVMKVLVEYAKDRQIIISTHSPYYVSWNAIVNGAALIRIHKDEFDTVCNCISDNVRRFAASILRDTHNIHTLGINATEALFLSDNLVLVEGQEDVAIYSKALDALGVELNGEFFGWGVGGEPKMPGFLNLFYELGYKKVVAIYDGDKADSAELMKKKYPEYRIFVIPEDDVRDKEEITTTKKTGIADKHWNIKEQYKPFIQDLFNNINQYLIS